MTFNTRRGFTFHTYSHYFLMRIEGLQYLPFCRPRPGEETQSSLRLANHWMSVLPSPLANRQQGRRRLPLARRQGMTAAAAFTVAIAVSVFVRGNGHRHEHWSKHEHSYVQVQESSPDSISTHHRCIHDEISRPDPALPASRSRVLYNHGSDGANSKDGKVSRRHRSLESTQNNRTSRERLRIHAEYVKLDGTAGADSTDSSLVSLVHSTLVPSASAFWSSVLYTHPVEGPLRFDRNCDLGFDLGEKGQTCYSLADPETCSAIDASTQKIPEKWLNARETCSSCDSSGFCSECSTVPEGPGQPDTDFAILVTIADTSDW